MSVRTGAVTETYVYNDSSPSKAAKLCMLMHHTGKHGRKDHMLLAAVTLREQQREGKPPGKEAGAALHTAARATKVHFLDKEP